MSKRIIKVQVVVSEEELAELKAAADEAGLSLSPFCRMLLVGKLKSWQNKEVLEEDGSGY
jgi:hypothetical protein